MTDLGRFHRIRDDLHDMSDRSDNARLRPRRPLPWTWTIFALGFTASINDQAKPTFHCPQARQARPSLPDHRANPEAWPQQHEWLYDRLNDLHRVFHNRIKALG